MKTANFKGYTLLEILMTMGIASVLLTIGVPGLQTFTKNNHILSTTNIIMTALKTARSEAMTQRLDVVVCGTDDFVNCGGTVNYMAFTDADSNGAVNGSDTIVYTNLLSQSIEYIECDTCSDDETIIFNRRGTAIANNGTLTVCDDRGNSYARGIIIEPIGRSRSATDTDITADGIPNNHKGVNLVCPS